MGPRTTDELHSWSRHDIANLSELERQTVLDKFEGGIAFNSNYSGAMTFFQAAEHLGVVLEEQIGDTNAVGMIRLFSTDPDRDCGNIAREWRSNLRNGGKGLVDPVHLTSILDGLPAGARQRIDELIDIIDSVDIDDSTFNTKVNETAQFFKTNCEDIFSHGLHTSFDDFGDSRMFTIETAGHICTAWSPSGRRQGWRHMSGPLFIVWAARTRKIKPDLVLTECHAHFPTAVFEYWFEDLYHAESFVAERSHVGGPVDRPRMLTWLILFRWQLEGSAANFLEESRRSVELTGDDLMAAPLHLIREEFVKLLRLRGLPENIDPDPSAFDWSCLYTPHQRHVLAQFNEIRRDRQHLNGTLLANLTNNLNWGPEAHFEIGDNHCQVVFV